MSNSNLAELKEAVSDLISNVQSYETLPSGSMIKDTILFNISSSVIKIKKMFDINHSDFHEKRNWILESTNNGEFRCLEKRNIKLLNCIPTI